MGYACADTSQRARTLRNEQPTQLLLVGATRRPGACALLSGGRDLARPTHSDMLYCSQSISAIFCKPSIRTCNLQILQSIVQNWKVFDFWKLYEVNHLKHLYSSCQIREMGCSCESKSIIIFPWIVGSVLNIVVFFTSGCATSKSF